ncbi:hypothetical protein [Pseudomonas putida]|uniref:Uncharacterized protein n=1 Tax=Pseudomonas putida TaxID=303 RepID=A0AAW4C4W9_PSEPU|nr:hypothetical protein [Pseudomonas putida]MBF8705090.1 hypothetical protein [Pseudomonas putida]MBF8739358.1 hypothetical protein [Pseudomonas putida]
MSLETEIAALTATAKSLIDYFNLKKSDIDKAVAAAVAAVPAMERTWYINQVTGSDDNAGTIAAPFASIDKAIASTPSGGTCNIRLMSDYIHTKSTVVSVRNLLIASDVTGVKRKFSLTYQMGSDAQYFLSGFAMSSSATVAFLDVLQVMPSPAGLNPAPSGTANIMFRSFSLQIAALYAIKYASCEMQMPADFVGYLALQHTNGLVLQVVSSSFPSGFAGRYAYGVPAGALSKDYPNIMINLSTL